jgi:tRNA threonylcarbamoyladenosine biosynthesis protein TsaB
MTVRLLAIDTTEEACSAALLVEGGVVERFELAPRRHSELLLPMMEGLLAEAGLRLTDLDALGFARGPGSFTGVRIAASVVQGAAMGAGLPVVPVSSLQALAQGAARVQGARAVLTALDARMDEVYWGAYRADAEGLMRAVIDETVCAPRHVPVPSGGDWHGVGSGWATYAPELGARCAMHLPRDTAARVHAQDVATLAAALFAAGGAVSAEQAVPVYLRDEVAWAKPA